MSDEARDRSPVRPGAIVGGKYRVERIIGAGGMGIVVAATHTELGQPVALKFILPEAVKGKEANARFLREAQSVARLRSEHVARVFDVGRDAEDNPFMVLELLEGEELAKINREKGPLPVADAVEYVLQACAGLVEAHAAGIIHRDLKPQNLFVTRRMNGLPLVKVLDFGIAKTVGAAAVGQVSITDSKAIIGSPLYMPPEQMRSSRSADTRSDIWSIGVILYELLGGRHPFQGETVTEICVAVMSEEPPGLLSLRPGLDPLLAAIAMRCLHKDPDRRFQNVAHLGAALAPYAKSSQQGGAASRPWQSFEDTIDSQSQPAPTRTQPFSTPPLPMASTDVSWGDNARMSTSPPRAGFAKGLLVGVVVSLVAIAAMVVVLVPRLTPKPAHVAAAPPVASSVAVVPVAVASALSSSAPPPAPAASVAPVVVAPRRKRPRPSQPEPVQTQAPVAPPAPPASGPADAPNGAPILR